MALARTMKVLLLAVCLGLAWHGTAGVSLRGQGPSTDTDTDTDTETAKADKPGISDEDRAAMKACREAKDSDAEPTQACTDLFERLGKGKGSKGKGKGKGNTGERQGGNKGEHNGDDGERARREEPQEVSDEDKAAMKVCRKAQKSGADATPECADLFERLGKGNKGGNKGGNKDQEDREDRPEVSDEDRAAMKACREAKDSDAEPTQACTDLFARLGKGKGNKGGNKGGSKGGNKDREDRPEISDEDRAAMKACREAKDGDAEPTQACTDLFERLGKGKGKGSKGKGKGKGRGN